MADRGSVIARRTPERDPKFEITDRRVLPCSPKYWLGLVSTHNVSLTGVYLSQNFMNETANITYFT